jgi:hypothetical protein
MKKSTMILAAGALVFGGLVIAAANEKPDPERVRVAKIEYEQRTAAKAEATRVADAQRAAEQAERAAKRAAEQAEYEAKKAAEKAEAQRIAALPIARRETGDAALYMACKAAQSHVEQFLKAPASAEFESCFFNARGKLEGNVYTILTTVDAQNSFGALIRGSYLVKVDGSGKDWKGTGTPKQIR